MSSSRAIAAFVVAIAGLVLGLPSHALTGRTVVLTSAEVTRLGIATAPLTSTDFTPRIHGYGVVVDLGALSQAEANVATADAAARASGADVKRARDLFKLDAGVSKQSLDASEKQSATDEAALLLAQRQEMVQFGPKAPWRTDRSVLGDLTAGRAVLVRATFPLDTFRTSDPPNIYVTHLSAQADEPGWTSKRFWSAPADPTIPGRSYFALFTGSDLQSGEHVLAYAPTAAPMMGTYIPAAAVLLSESKIWCYVEIATNTFQRVQIDLKRPARDGYFVSIPAAKAVVTRGTGLLLARELGTAMLIRN